MLTAVGGTPRINTTDVVPTYPGPLPGGVHPDLVVSLGSAGSRTLEQTEIYQAVSVSYRDIDASPSAREVSRNAASRAFSSAGRLERTAHTA